MRNKVIAIFLASIFIINNIYGININTDLKIEVVSSILKEYLKTSTQEVIYTGTVKEKNYSNYPKQGYQYLLIDIRITNESSTSRVLDLSEFRIKIKNETYKKVSEDSFLKDHKMKCIPDKIEAYESVEGTLLFEVPDTLRQEDLKETSLEFDNYNIQLSTMESLDSNIRYKESVTEEQFEKEKKLLTYYYEGEYSEDNPLVVLNPYDIAPLTALVMFETKEEAEVTVTVKGKDKYTDIVYTKKGKNLHHEIPIIGLYAGSNNTVTLKIDYGNKRTKIVNIGIQTDALPDYIDSKGIQVTISEKEKMQNGFIFVIEGNRVLLDKNGDIRWYLSTYASTSGAEAFLDNGHMIIPINNYDRWSKVWEMDWLGKVYWEYSNEGFFHHDATEMDNGNLLLFYSNRLIEVNKSTGNIVRDIPMEEILPYMPSAEIRSENSIDWCHENTIIYDNGKIILSARNQHTVVKLDYKTLEIEWIFSPGIAYRDLYGDKYLQPKGDDFEWFYSQHQPSILSDLDNNPDTLDIVLFDNGVHRAITKEEAIEAEEAYSRIVHYRINEKEKTVEQIWDFGKEMGNEFYASIHSGAQYLEESGNYIGAFDAMSQTWPTAGWETYFNEPQTSKVVEVTNEGEIVFQAEFKDYIYRAYKKSIKDISTGFNPLGTVKGINNTATKSKSQTIDFREKEQISKSIKYEISGINYSERYLNIEGWAYIEGKENQEVDIYLELSCGSAVYHYKLGRDDTINIPNVVNQKGFKEPYLELSDLKDGKYTMKIILATDKEVYVDNLPYYFTIKKDKNIYIQEESLISQQDIQTQSIKNKLEKNIYTIDNPLVIQDPYKLSPLTALVSFNTVKPMKVAVEVKGKTEDTSITHEFESYETEHIIPIYGLYADYNNQVIITLTDVDGNKKEKGIEIITQELPNDLPRAEITVDKGESNKEDLLFAASTYLMAFDNAGEVRWYLSDKTMGGGTTPILRLANGNLAIMSNRNVRSMYYQTGVYEIDLFGHIYNEYIVQGSHHEIQELTNGNLLIAAEKDDKTTEDYIVEIDRETGKVVRSWDIGEILNIEKIADATYSYQTYQDNKVSMVEANEGEIESVTRHTSEHDWFHNNAFDYIEEEGTMIVSGRQQDMVFKFDTKTGEIKWILSDPSDDFPDHLKDKLLVPQGEGFEWQYGQHAVMQLPDGNIMLYDNGNFRSKSVGEMLDANDNYSRGVIYKVNEENMTVEQVWQYGKERGKELYTSYIGDVDYLGENHYLINFGGIIQDDEGNTFNTPMAILGMDNTKGMATIVEIKDDEVIREYSITSNKNANTYRVELMSLYTEEENYIDFTKVAKRKGELRATATVQMTLSNPTDLANVVNSISDEADRIIVDIDVVGAMKNDKLYIVLESVQENKRYVFDAQNTSNYINMTINKTGIATGSYTVGIAVENSKSNKYTKTDYIVRVK